MTRGWSVGVLAVVGTVALVGCGGGKKAAPGTTTSGATTSSATSSTTTTAKGGSTTTTAKGGSTTTGTGVQTVPSEEQLEAALLADADVPGFTVEKGRSSDDPTSSDATACEGKKFEVFELPTVEAELMVGDESKASEALAATSAAEMERLFAQTRDVVAACDGKSFQPAGSELPGTIARTAGPQLADETLTFDLAYAAPPEQGPVAAHFVLVRTGTVMVGVVGFEAGPGGLDAPATVDLARKALDKVATTLQ